MILPDDNVIPDGVDISKVVDIPEVVEPMTNKEEWEKMNLGFKLLPPICKRAIVRPKKIRLVGVEEGGSSNKGKRRCKVCGGFGHFEKACNEAVVDTNAPPKKRMIYKPKVVEIIETTESLQVQKRNASSKGKQPKKKKATPTEATPPKQATQYVIRTYIS